MTIRKDRKSKFLSTDMVNRIEAMRNTEEVKLKNREMLTNMENRQIEEEEFIEKFYRKELNKTRKNK